MKTQLWIAAFTLMSIGNSDCQCTDRLIAGIKDEYITATSYNTYGCLPPYVRINSSDVEKTWCPATARKTEYLQVEFQYAASVTAFMFRGRQYKYITTFTLKTSLDGITWSNVTDTAGNKKIYPANEDDTTLVTRPVNENILAKFIRIHPETWYNSPAFQMEIIGCPSGRRCWNGKIGIPDEDLPLIHQTTASNNGYCGKECYKYPSCGSFMFDPETTECHLYSIDKINVTAQESTLSRKVYYERSNNCIP